MSASPDPVERALAYPFTQPAQSYIFTDTREYPCLGSHGEWTPALPVEIDGAVSDYATLAARLGCDASAARTAVLGYVSNPSVEVLRRKFAGMPGRCIPVLRVAVRGVEVVYSAHMHGGYVPATLFPAPDTCVAACVLYLTNEELVRVHETESLGVNYALMRLPAVAVTFPDGSCADGALTYLSLHGVLAPGRAPIPLAAVTGTGRLPGAASERQVLERVREVVAPTVRLRDVVVASARSAQTSAAYTAALRKWAQQPEWLAVERIAP